MELYGIGTDIVEVSRVKNAIEKRSAFLQRVFTEQEIMYCEDKNKTKYESYAVRFAAKEAVAKSLLQGIGENVSFREIEILVNSGGSPFVCLNGRSKIYTDKIGIKEIKISLSSTKNYATAIAASLR